ncbi:hypothetical protein GPECTOR_9g740 [Gonium pectorale]|uniref:Uncharacterized protein n=1 Tax=Gonium pectorale TaxID=33097 RepID=A0A150GSE0_GONPE|nr:hypothetical protein GPECTOR_9g740 [Gonium pectorale]|eukprot:KXZ52694.1 hypothetical protein GPECTOR_9g740 [Gonium pectorale]
MEGIHGLLRLADQLRLSVEAGAERRADPSRRTAVDVLLAVLALLAAAVTVLGCIALGWWVLWRTTLHRIGMFRDMLGLNRVAKAEAKRRAEEEIRALRSQLSAQHGSWQRHPHGAEGEGEGEAQADGSGGQRRFKDE